MFLNEKLNIQLNINGDLAGAIALATAQSLHMPSQNGHSAYRLHLAIFHCIIIYIQFIIQMFNESCYTYYVALPRGIFWSKIAAKIITLTVVKMYTQ